MKKLFTALFLLASSLYCNPVQEKPIVIVIPSYNNSKWSNWNLQSVLMQEYTNYRIIYIDDCSTDTTAEDIEKLAITHTLRNKKSFCTIYFDDYRSKDIPQTTHQFQTIINQNSCFITLVINKNRAGALANLYRAILSCSDNEIIVTLDGDDWLSDPHALKRLNAVYSEDNVWLTHGNMIEYPSGSNLWSEPIPPAIISNNLFRTFKCPSHLRTFYSWLFKKIQLSDLLFKGDFFSMTWDMAIMYPMIEMCGERHKFITQPNYIYNMSNPINDNKVNAELQRTLDHYIRSKTPYKRLN